MKDRGLRSLLVLMAAVGSLPSAGLASEIHLNGGSLRVEGSLGAGTLNVAPGATLMGGGTFVGAVTAAGAIAPGGPGPTSVGTLAIQGPVAFMPGSIFACYAATHTNMDRLQALGAIGGTCQVQVAKAPDAIPLQQTVMSGAGGSAYSGFALGGVNASQWRIEVGGSQLLLTDLFGDSNVNGIPDWWEAAYFNGRTNAVATADPDQDGANNLGEYVAGTLPGDSNSVFKITSVKQLDADTLGIWWTSATGRTYTLEYSTNLMADQGGFTFGGSVSADPPTNYAPLGGIAPYPSLHFRFRATYP